MAVARRMKWTWRRMGRGQGGWSAPVRAGVLAAALAASCTGPPEEQGPAAPRPNILFVMSDDHTANALGCYPSRLSALAPTPRLDALAAEGARLANVFCTNSICVPSRASILTGQYSHVNGVFSLAHALDPSRDNVAKRLQAAGYQTALIGKWHLKEDPSGFDYWNVLPGQGRYQDPVLREKGASAERTYQGFSTDVITDLSLAWLAGRDESRPFCLMTHFKNCHEPWNWAERHGDLFADVEIPEPDSLFEDQAHRSDGSRDLGLTVDTMASRMEKPGHGHDVLDTTGMDPEQGRRAAYQKFAKDYLRCVAAIDENVGRLLDYLDEAGLADNTLVIYTSDQGYFLGEHGYIDKRWMFEESLRMPFLARYPAEIAAGTVNEDIITNVDFASTFLDYAGVATPPAWQGRSFRANLAGHTPPDWPGSMYYHYWAQGTRPAHYGVRTKRYKLIFFHGVPIEGRAEGGAAQTRSGWELYDLHADPKELHNVHDDPAYAIVVRDLTAELDRLKLALGDRDENYAEIVRAREAHR